MSVDNGSVGRQGQTRARPFHGGSTQGRRNLRKLRNATRALFAAARSVGSSVLASEERAGQDADWAINVSVLESCSSPVFCPCSFTGKPPASSAMHQGQAMTQHVCRFNQAYKVNSGHAGSVRFDNARFWFLGDVGDDFEKPKLDWAVLTFDSSLPAEQRDAVLGVLRHLR